MTQKGLPETMRISYKAEEIVLAARARIRAGKSNEEEVWKFALATCYRPQGLAKLLTIFGHVNPMFLTGTAKAVYGCCAAKALKPVIKRSSKGECAIVISAPS